MQVAQVPTPAQFDKALLCEINKTIPLSKKEEDNLYILRKKIC